MTNMMKKTLSLLAALVLSLTFAPSAASADEGEPGPWYENLKDCVQITDLNCNAEVTNLYLAGGYVQIVNGNWQRNLYWPFRNPTANAHAAMGAPGAFPSDYTYVKAENARLMTKVERKNATIARLRAKIERLRDR